MYILTSYVEFHIIYAIDIIEIYNKIKISDIYDIFKELCVKLQNK
jgi:hypothetical protein